MLLVSSSRSGYHHGDLAHALETAAMQLLAEKPAQGIPEHLPDFFIGQLDLIHAYSLRS